MIVVATTAMACTAGQPEHSEHSEHPPDYLAESDIVRIAQEADGFQRDILADGKVTFGEYEKATLATVECIRQANLPAGRITVNGPYQRKLGNGRVDDRFLSYDVELLGEPAKDDSSVEEWGIAVRDGLDKITDDCRDAYLTDVDRVWTFQHLLTPAEREDQRARIVECLQATGLDLSASATAEDIFRLIAENPENAAVADCRDTYPDFFVVGVT